MQRISSSKMRKLKLRCPLLIKMSKNQHRLLKMLLKSHSLTQKCFKATANLIKRKWIKSIRTEVTCFSKRLAMKKLVVHLLITIITIMNMHNNMKKSHCQVEVTTILTIILGSTLMLVTKDRKVMAPNMANQLDQLSYLLLNTVKEVIRVDAEQQTIKINTCLKWMQMQKIMESSIWICMVFSKKRIIN